MTAVCYFMRPVLLASGMFVVVSASILLTSQPMFAEDGYSLDGGIETGESNPEEGLVDDFLDEEKPNTLFDSNGVQQPHLSNNASVTTSPTPPAESIPAISIVPAPAVATPSPVSNILGGGGAGSGGLESPVAADFVGPLTTDGSIAPVKLVEPMKPNEFSGVPALPGSRRTLAPGQAPDFYMVEQGDTLFDVCSQLIDDGNYWPKLWALNPDVKNPHFIYPGMKLGFYPGDNLEPPRIEVVEEDDMVPVDKGPLQEAELVAQETDFSGIIKSNSNISSVTQESVEVIGPEGVNVDEATLGLFIDAGARHRDQGITVQLPGFIFPEEIENLGVVQGGARREGLAGDGVEIVVDEVNGVESGQVYTVLRPRGEIDDPIADDTLGYRYDFVANVRMRGRIDDERYTGIVQDSRIGVRPRDIIVSYRSTRRNAGQLVVNGPLNNAAAAIVGMDMDSQIFAGTGGLVFLGKGNLTTGTLYGVYKTTPRDLTLASADRNNPEEVGRNVGVLKIIDSSDISSVAIVVSSKLEMRVGDQLQP